MIAFFLRCGYQIGKAIDHHRGLGNDADDNAHDVHSCAYKPVGEEIVYHIYADRLCITPNYLSSIVRRNSGLTVMQWINRHIIQQAKLQLKYSDLPVWQIAESLNFPNPSFFSKLFKRETSMTPGEYRNR